MVTERHRRSASRRSATTKNGCSVFTMPRLPPARGRAPYSGCCPTTPWPTVVAGDLLPPSAAATTATFGGITEHRHRSSSELRALLRPPTAGVSDLSPRPRTPLRESDRYVDTTTPARLLAGCTVAGVLPRSSERRRCPPLPRHVLGPGRSARAPGLRGAPAGAFWLTSSPAQGGTPHVGVSATRRGVHRWPVSQ